MNIKRTKEQKIREETARKTKRDSALGMKHKGSDTITIAELTGLTTKEIEKL